MEIYSRVMRGCGAFFQKKNLPNFALIFYLVVEGTVVVALGQQEVGHWRYNLNAVVVDKCLMIVADSFAEVGHDDLGVGLGVVLGVVLEVDNDLGHILPEVDFLRVQLGAAKFFVPQLQLQRRLSFGVQLV